MLRIENAADHREALAQVGRWHWDEWGSADPNGSLQSWTKALEGKATREGIPLTLLAYVDGRLVGAVSLIDHDMPDRGDLAGLTPWVAGTYVVPEMRGEGVGSALMRRVAEEAKRLSIDRVYLYTAHASEFYDGLGWTRELETWYEGELVTVMSLST
jgi:GNAT superfamily N-acetyltransferase